MKTSNSIPAKSRSGNRPSAKQRKVQNYLLNKIRKNMKPGDLLPSVAELSDILKISPMTIHRAVNQMVSEDILYKIQGKGTFVGESAPVSTSLFQRNGKQVIAFISPFQHDDDFMRDITMGVMQGINHDKYTLINTHVWIPRLTEEKVLSETAAQADGIILLSHLSDKSQKVIAELQEQCYPLVFVDNYPAGLPCTAVSCDNEEAVFIAMRHLFDLGHRHILHVTSTNHHISTQKRQKAFMQFMQRHDLNTSCIRIDDANDQKHLTDLLNADAVLRPTAIFALHDSLAKECYAVVKNCGLRIPEDISLVGFNNDIGVDQFEVPLTTIAQPKFRIGQKAAQIMQDMLEGHLTVPSKYYFSGELLERKSTCSCEPSAVVL